MKKNKQVNMLILPNDVRISINRIESYRSFKREDVQIRTFSSNTIDLHFDGKEEREVFMNFLDTSLEAISLEDILSEETE